jgi:hypothetical protein
VAATSVSFHFRIAGSLSEIASINSQLQHRRPHSFKSDEVERIINVIIPPERAKSRGCWDSLSARALVHCRSGLPYRLFSG